MVSFEHNNGMFLLHPSMILDGEVSFPCHIDERGRNLLDSVICVAMKIVGNTCKTIKLLEMDSCCPKVENSSNVMAPNLAQHMG